MLLACSRLRAEVEAIRIHDFRPSRNKLLDEPVLRRVAGIDLRDSSQLRLGAENKIYSRRLPFALARLAIKAFKDLAVLALLPFRIDIEQVLEEVV